jgi:hypothetical protein
MHNKQSAFNWQGQPSIFAKDPVFNGVRTAVAERAAENVTQTVYLRGSNVFLADTGKQVIAHSKAKSRGG